MGQPGQQGLNRFPHLGVHPSWRNLGERDEDETAGREPGMGQLEVARLSAPDDTVIIEQVEVERARRVRRAPPPAVARLYRVEGG